MVDPYIIIMSPELLTPTLKASAAASIVPVVTGVPNFNPVSFKTYLKNKKSYFHIINLFGNKLISIISLLNSLLQHFFFIS